MTQLSNDCFEHADRLMPLAEALDLLASRIVPIAEIERVPLERCCARILGETVYAERDVPPHDNSAVDGYAVYADDLRDEETSILPVTGRVAAGHPLDRPARRGEALRVFTGACMPKGENDAGPDTVLMQEDCTVRGEIVEIPPGISRGANRRDAGEDIKRGDEVLQAGRRLRPEDVGLLASLGRTDLPVRAPLRVALFSTGDEVCDPGDRLRPGAIYDANRYTLTALLGDLECTVSDLGILRDTPDALADALASAARSHDILVTSGGVSVGAEDHVRSALDSIGGLTLWRLAIKPGRPVALGHIDEGTRSVPFVGLPGNPAAVMVTFLLFARPLILRLAGARDVAPTVYPVKAGFAQTKKYGRREFVRCRLERSEDSTPVAVKAGRQGAGLLSTVAAADGLVELPEEMTYVERGMAVDFLPFNEVR